MNNQNSQILNDLYSKSMKLESKLNNLNKEINNKLFDNTIDKAKIKSEEIIFNFEKTIKSLEDELNVNINYFNSNTIDIWKNKIDNLKLSLKNSSLNLNKAIKSRSIVKSKKTCNNYNYFKSDSNEANINYLNNEHNSLINILKLSTEVDSQQNLLNNELDIQQSTLDKIKKTTLNMLYKADFANTITNWIIKRGKNDTIIFFILVFLTFFLIYISFYYIKPWFRNLVKFN